MIYLVRHAHTSWQPNENRPLSRKGLAGAEAVAESLKGRDISAIYSSPYRRALDTVGPLASSLKLEIGIEDDLRERELGDLGGRDFKTVIRECWRAPQSNPGDGESNRQAQTRALRILHSVLARHGNRSVVLSTHGNLLALMLGAYDDSIGYSFWRALTMPDIYALRPDPSGRAAIFRIRGPGVRNER